MCSPTVPPHPPHITLHYIFSLGSRRLCLPDEHKSTGPGVAANCKKQRRHNPLSWRACNSSLHVIATRFPWVQCRSLSLTEMLIEYLKVQFRFPKLHQRTNNGTESLVWRCYWWERKMYILDYLAHQCIKTPVF